MHPAYGDKCFTKPTVHVWCKKMLGGQIFSPYTEVQSNVRQCFEQARREPQRGPGKHSRGPPKHVRGAYLGIIF